MWIDRNITHKIQTLANKFPVIVLTGARQVGKTALVREIWKNTSYVSLDLPSVAEKAENDGLEFLKSYSAPLIIDEVQYAPQLFRYLKHKIDEKREENGRFILTGSQKFVLMKAVSESLAGRCAIIELNTLSASEIMGSGGGYSAEEMLWRGGFPALYNKSIALAPQEFFPSYIATYLERDIRQIMQVSDLRNFERFLRACALRAGHLVNYADLARDVGIAPTTAKDWLGVMQASNQIILLEPYFGNHSKRIAKSPKLYFSDTGLLCFLLNINSPENMAASPFIGQLWENFVLLQIICSRNAAADKKSNIWFWRDANGLEADFIIEKDNRLQIVEAKWSEEYSGGKTITKIEKIKAKIGEEAETNHIIATRTADERRLGQHDIWVINAINHLNWL